MLALALAATLLASPATPHRVVVERTLHLPAGPSQRSFDFTIHAQFADSVTLTVPHGSRVSFLALSANHMEMLSGGTSPAWAPCEHRGSLDVCTQGQEWCGLIEGRWRATVASRSRSPITVRVRLVFVESVRQG